MELSQTKILITGGVKRIGRQISLELARRGARLFIHYNTSSNEMESLQEEITGEHTFLQADFTSEIEVENLVSQIQGQGGVDILINNASVFYPTSSLSEILSSWDHLFEVNLKVPLTLAYALGAEMSKKGEGKIINIGDIYGEFPLENHVPYCLTKAGLLMLTRCLARELSPSIQVNTISPGAILLPEGASPESEEDRVKKIPLARMGDPLQIAQAVLYLIETDYVTGQDIQIDGGRTLNI